MLWTGRTGSGSGRPAGLDPPACAGRVGEADAGAQVRRDNTQRGTERTIRGGGFAPAGDPEGSETQPHRSLRVFDGKAEASKSWLAHGGGEACKKKGNKKKKISP